MTINHLITPTGLHRHSWRPSIVPFRRCSQRSCWWSPCLLAITLATGKAICSWRQQRETQKTFLKTQNTVEEHIHTRTDWEHKDYDLVFLGAWILFIINIMSPPDSIFAYTVLNRATSHLLFFLLSLFSIRLFIVKKLTDWLLIFKKCRTTGK